MIVVSPIRFSHSPAVDLTNIREFDPHLELHISHYSGHTGFVFFFFGKSTTVFIIISHTAQRETVHVYLRIRKPYVRRITFSIFPSRHHRVRSISRGLENNNNNYYEYARFVIVQTYIRYHYCTRTHINRLCDYLVILNTNACRRILRMTWYYLYRIGDLRSHAYTFV